MVKTKISVSKGFGYLSLYALTAVILFIPIINKYFVSDDFVVIKRVCLDGTIRVQGFFRPLSDCSIYVNYLVSRLNPSGFNLVNILIHGLNSYLLFELCCKWNWASDIKKQRSYAFIASILFLSYPFHNEAIVWLLGRGASLAGTFGILALLIFFSSFKTNTNYFGVCICYFIGLLAYESIIVLPAMIFILLIEKKVSNQLYLKWTIAFLITAVVHFAARYYFSGALFGGYGENLFKTPWRHYPGNLAKAIMRLIIPPINNSLLFSFISVTVMLAGTVLLLRAIIKFKSKRVNKGFVISLLCILGCSLVVPFLFAVSTKTSESDRFLYFPSVFVCCLASFLINRLIETPTRRLLIVASLCFYNVILLESNNINWMRAGNATYSIIQILKSDSASGICIANLPNETKGAYIFREGFKEALIVNKIDTGRFIIINKLSKEQKTDSREIWKPVYYEKKLFIPPELEVLLDKGFDTFPEKKGMLYYRLPALSHLYYWNQRSLILWKDQDDTL